MKAQEFFPNSAAILVFVGWLSIADKSNLKIYFLLWNWVLALLAWKSMPPPPMGYIYGRLFCIVVGFRNYIYTVDVSTVDRIHTVQKLALLARFKPEMFRSSL